MPSLIELLRASQAHDAKGQVQRVKINKAIVEAGTVMPAELVPVEQLDLATEEESDPFQGNQNNRRVAERIANTFKNRKYLNNSEPTHVGDPSKALADIEKSKRLNPDPPELEKDAPFPPISLPATPTPGSPAAVKAAGEQKPAQPPTWKPNA